MSDKQMECPGIPIEKRLSHLNYPVTPNNSQTTTPSGDWRHELPSFNNAETVRKVHEKKRKLDIGTEATDSQLCFPFTPQNSSVDSTFENFARQNNFPSFCTTEMVEKIQAKRKSLDILREDGIEFSGTDSGRMDKMVDDFSMNPFMPNNVSDNQFDKLANVNQPSMRNSETVRQIREKREKLKQNVLQNAGFPSKEGEGLLIDVTSEAEPFMQMSDNNPFRIDAKEQANDVGNLYDFGNSGNCNPFATQNCTTMQNCAATQVFEQFEHYAHEQGVPSFNSMVKVEKILERRNSQPNKKSPLPKTLNTLKNAPFTPQNSYTNLGNFAPLGHTDKYITQGFVFDPEELVSRVATKRKMSECLDLDAIDNGDSSSEEEVMFAFDENLPGETPSGEIEKDSDSSASSGSESLSAYENFMHGVSSSDEGLSHYLGCITGADNGKEIEIAQKFVAGILESAVEIMRRDQSRILVDNVICQSKALIQDEGETCILPEESEINLSQVNNDIGESEPLLESVTTTISQSHSPRHTLKRSRVRFSVDDGELSHDAYAEIIADEIAGNDDSVVPIGGILQINAEDGLEQNAMFTHDWDSSASDDSSDSEGHAGSYDVNALNEDVVKNVAQTFVDDIIKEATKKYQNETQEKAMKKIADEFVAGVLKSASNEYKQSCEEAAAEFCAELIRQALDDFTTPDSKNDASDDTGIFDTSDEFVSPAGERLGKLNSIDSDIGNGNRRGTPKSLSLDSPMQFKHDHSESESHVAVKKLKKNLSEPTPGFGRRMSDLDLETEYLCSYDPLFGNMEIVSSPDHSFATDAVRDIAENASFKRMRKESGIFDDSDGEDMDSMKKFLELRAMQEHFAKQTTTPSDDDDVNYEVPQNGAMHNEGGTFKVPSGVNSTNYNCTSGDGNNHGNHSDRINCDRPNNRRPEYRRHSDAGPSVLTSRPNTVENRRDGAQDASIDRGYRRGRGARGRGSRALGRGFEAWDEGSHGIQECESVKGISDACYDGDNYGVGEVGENGVRFLQSTGSSSGSSGLHWGDKSVKNDQTWISSADGLNDTETEPLLGRDTERHFGVNSTVSDADACEDLSEREDSEVFLDDSAAALLGSAAGSRRSSAKLSRSSAGTWSSHGSKSEFGSVSDPGTTFGDYVRDLFIHVRRHNGDIVVLRKTFVQDKMSKLGIKMEKASQKEIFYTTAGRISIQVDSFPEFLEDGTRVIDEDGFVQLLGGRYEISQELLDSADKLCKKIDEIKENERMTEEGGNITNADDVVREIEASSTPTKVPDVVHDTEGSDSEDNNNDTKKFSRPSTLETSGSFRRKIRIKNMEELDFKNERFPSVGEADTLSNDNVDLNKTFDPDDIQTPDELDTPDLEALGVTDSDWDDDDDESTTPEGDSDNAVEPIPEYSATEEFQDSRNWRKVTIAEKTFKIDMKVIEPYKKVLSHGGYYGDGLNAIIIFASCYLPDKGRRDYNYVMDNLFLYVISTLELLVAEDYMIVYFHGSTPRTRMPTISWMRRCYQIIDRRLRKNLKGLLLVHPTFWLKTVILMTRPFISTKFSSKVKFIHSLKDLGDTIPMEYVFVPDQVKRYDALMRKRNSIASNVSSPTTPVSPR